MAISLSIVIPAKNEERNIARSLDSLIKNISLDNTEILLVDCASRDNTINIALKYPVKILQLKPSWIHSASAARYIGTLFSSGKYIYFIDSDMTLEAGFLEAAMDILSKDEHAAGVGGIGKEIYLKNDKEVGIEPNLYKTKNAPKKVSFLGGSVLYLKEALVQAGGFNPFLMTAEEVELGARLRKKGYGLVSIPHPMIIHYTSPIGEWEEFERKKKAKLFLGIGQALRVQCFSRYLFEALVYYWQYLLYLMYILFVFIVAGAYLIKSKAFLEMVYIIPAPIILLYATLVIKKKSFKKGLISLIKWIIISIEISRGVMMRKNDPESYPKDPLIIKGEFI